MNLLDYETYTNPFEGRRHQFVGILKITGCLAKLLLLPFGLHVIEAPHKRHFIHAANRFQSHYVFKKS